MTLAADRPARPRLTGNRIRERRLLLGVKQASLAEAAGISPSYLNLIEHNRRKIGGTLLIRIARCLGVEPGFLSDGVDATVHDTLRLAAEDLGPNGGGDAETEPETDRIDDLAARFPGWTRLLVQQRRRISDLEAALEGLRDRLGHDPVLSETMHEILSSAAAIRSTAEILARERDLDAAWLGRFHRNLHEEAERLSARATAMLGQFEAPGPGPGRAPALKATPVETAEAMFEANDHHFAEIESFGMRAVPRVLDRASGMDDPACRARGEAMLAAYAEDAARLPMRELLPAARAAGFRPEALVHLGEGDVALVLRRLAALPAGEGVPPFGLAICDASGALVFRRRLAAFSIPRFGPGCPLWPLYRALSRPGQPDSARLEMPNGPRFLGWAVAQGVAPTGFGQAPVMRATMLVTPDPDAASAGPAPVLAGPGCAVCPRMACPARR
ncbi:MAG: short-chain fatty acyl-CoA regulator family protein [Roseicyclus sp.]